jgi:hypothetical protein
MRAVRTGSTLEELETEGLHVFLLDAHARGGLILREAATGVVDADPERLDGESKRKELVAFELQEDGFTRIEIAVGKPLSAAELKKARWWKPVRARLALESGRLRVETSESLEQSLSQEKTPFAFEVALPRGEYVLTLHRRRYVDVPDGTPEDQLPFQVVTLTPVAELEPPADWSPWIPYPDE